ADDYITKPFNTEELRARLSVGVRVVNLEHSLESRIRELQEALDNVRTLETLLPICSYCKRIRDDRNYWAGVEEYISSHSDSKFSHGICPDCYMTIVEPQIKNLGSRD
ncbi:MAG: response regulator, partial [Blastocatellia bacterium]